MTSAETLHLAPKVEIAHDPFIVKDAETVDDRDRFARDCHNLVRVERKILLMADRENKGVDTREAGRQILRHLKVAQLLLVPEKAAAAVFRIGLLVSELPPDIHIGVVGPDLGPHLGKSPDKDLRPAVPGVSHVFPVGSAENQHLGAGDWLIHVP